MKTFFVFFCNTADPRHSSYALCDSQPQAREAKSQEDVQSEGSENHRFVWIPIQIRRRKDDRILSDLQRPQIPQDARLQTQIGSRRNGQKEGGLEKGEEGAQEQKEEAARKREGKLQLSTMSGLTYHCAVGLAVYVFQW